MDNVVWMSTNLNYVHHKINGLTSVVLSGNVILSYLIKIVIQVVFALVATTFKVIISVIH